MPGARAGVGVGAGETLGGMGRERAGPGGSSPDGKRERGAGRRCETENAVEDRKVRRSMCGRMRIELLTGRSGEKFQERRDTVKTWTALGEQVPN